MTTTTLHIDACIFDLDGVIVDTAHYHFLAWRRLANELGFDFDEAKNEQLKGVGRMESLDIILGWGKIEKSQAEKERLTAQKNEWYQAYIKEMKKEEILPGVQDFLDELRSRGVRLAVASSSKNAQTVLEVLGIQDDFGTIIDGTKITRSKPDPQVFQMAAEGLGVKPERSIVFEDAQSGVEAALKGNFYAVGVGKPEPLAEAHHVIAGFENVTLDGLLEKLAVEQV